MTDVSDKDLDLICRVTHEAMRAYRSGIGQDDLPTWKRAPKWMKEATRGSVRHVLDNPGQSAQMQHEQWAEQKRAAGWRHGRVKDARKKTHPLLVPYGDLDPDERRKDALVIAVVSAFLP